MKTLYISDLDGTLLQSNGTPSEFTVKTINDLIGKGMNITFATARSYSSAAKILPLFDLRIPAATMNGVFLTDTAGSTQKRVCFINRGAAMNVTDIMVNHGRPPFAYTYTRSGFLDVQYTVNKYDYEREFIADTTAADGHPEARVVDVGVAGHQNNVAAIPAKLIHLFTRHR